eukprot:TRINITY_DN13519_c0_g1_i13.p1 TRINITY_DN13519_c0_g1~~TRINITY_DN13519_c0_g1_i13.p1  ORF type:complete len:161 (-),score=18.64 TRINITY_DN13519_c0_g1_i13:746-1228(-)
MEQMLSGLKYLHDNKVMHGNLKSDNVLLDKKGNLKLTDYGLVREQDRKVYLNVGVSEGKVYDFADDIWSLGCILYELCSLKSMMLLWLISMAIESENSFTKELKLTIKGLLASIRPESTQGNITIKYFDNGDRYEGKLKNDKKNGRGIYYYSDLVKYDGQ